MFGIIFGIQIKKEIDMNRCEGRKILDGVLERMNELDDFVNSPYFKLIIDKFSFRKPHDDYYSAVNTYLYALKNYAEGRYDNVNNIIDKGGMEYDSVFNKFDEFYELRVYACIKMALEEQESIDLTRGNKNAESKVLQS